ncbi:uncharacterized protein STEHIDRAFT_151266 [Stereum hirsutum FP-91666 SS1]|uniref:uncharacterized protein n=1 Tax=Stereum hirsutum (strain FP-91666) TaxID=721885 RepID=UPI000440D2D8|nr:uncharacterized protein STEHIDRAFT_151266 [Stereum hirsutum FP-91666 SS1]EIM91912.1 hypothetical protein STEHIDRAFT_151266 [Stereum hirsutum FP-91666 SS1]
MITVLDTPGSRSDKSCQTLYILETAMQILSRITTSLIFTLRVYALWGQNKAILALTLLMIIAKFGIDVWRSTLSISLSSIGTQWNEFSMCWSIIADPTAVEHASLPILFDFIVFVATVLKTYQHSREMREHGRKSIAEVLLHDGTLYFFAVLVLAAVNLALRLLFVAHEDSQIVILLGDSMTPYISVRLCLNLRALNRPRTTVHRIDDGMPDQAFAHNRFLGNIGAPLDPDWWNEQLDDDEPQVDTISSINLQNSMEPAGGGGIVTLVPVVYDTGAVEMVPLEREAVPAAVLSHPVNGVV